jgi:hypothetical protein
VSAQMRPIINPTTSTATIAASQYKIRRLVMTAEPTLNGAREPPHPPRWLEKGAGRRPRP